MKYSLKLIDSLVQKVQLHKKHMRFDFQGKSFQIVIGFFFNARNKKWRQNGIKITGMPSSGKLLRKKSCGI
jgi:hypothetical protein